MAKHFESKESPSNEAAFIRTSGAPLWKTLLRHIPGMVPGVRLLRREYQNAYEQYLFLTRVAHETYGSPEPIFDSYQEEYSHEQLSEQERYHLVLDALQHFSSNLGDAIEIGCSKGLFTEKLARLCDSVLATDISPRACAITAERCTAFPNVTVKRLDIQREEIVGLYSLVFVMDTLSYVHGRRRLARVISKLTRAIRPGGMLVFSDVLFPENIQRAWWQHWLPEGAEQQLSMMSEQHELRLAYRKLHQNDTDLNHDYMDHLIAMFLKASEDAGPSRDSAS